MSSLFGLGLAFSLLYFTPPNIFRPPNIAVFYAIWALVGVLGIGSTPVTWSRTINMWFFESRGLALGILLLGTSISGLLIPQLAICFPGHCVAAAVHRIAGGFPAVSGPTPRRAPAVTGQYQRRVDWPDAGRGVPQLSLLIVGAVCGCDRAGLWRSTYSYGADGAAAWVQPGRGRIGHGLRGRRHFFRAGDYRAAV